MKLWELKEKLNALPEHDDDLDAVIGNEDNEFNLDSVIRHPGAPFPCIQFYTDKIMVLPSSDDICSECQGYI